MIKVNEKCKGCSCLSRVEFTFGHASRIPEGEQFYQCIADVESECLEGEKLNIKVEEQNNNE